MTLRGVFTNCVASFLTLIVGVALAATTVGCGRGEDLTSSSREHAMEMRWQGDVAAIELAAVCVGNETPKDGSYRDRSAAEQGRKNIQQIITQFKEQHQTYLEMLATEGLDVEKLINNPNDLVAAILITSSYRIDNLLQDKYLAEKILDRHLNKHGKGVHQPIFPKLLTLEEHRLVDRAWDEFGSYFDSPLVALIKFNNDIANTIQTEQEHYQTLQDLYSEKIVNP